MTYEQQLQTIIGLGFDTEERVYENDEFKVFLLRPSQPSSRFKFYDKNKNFQIWLHSDRRSFKPNHLRVIMDLDLRMRSRPDLKRQLALAFDRIFYGDAPLEAIASLKAENFQHYLNGLDITAVLAQLFIIEQAYGYHKPSNYNPPTLFFQGWVRQIFDSSNEIDDVIMSIAMRRPPSAKYTQQDDKNSKHYQSDATPLWWLSN